MQASIRLEQAHDGGDAERDAFMDSWSDLDEWGDPASGKDGWRLALGRERLRDRDASALKMIDDRIDDHPHDRELYEIRLELLESLGWEHLAEAQRRDLLRRFPSQYAPL